MSARITRRKFLLVAGGIGAGLAGGAWAFRARIRSRLSRWTRIEEFTAATGIA